MEWKTSNELKKELKKYVVKNADELIIELNEKRKNWSIKSNEKILCMK